MIILRPSASRQVRVVAFSPDGRTLATVGQREQSVTLWDLDARTERRRLVGPQKRVTSVAFSCDGGSLAAATGGGEVWLWSLSGSQPPHVQRWQSPKRNADPKVVFAPNHPARLLTTLHDEQRSWRALRLFSLLEHTKVSQRRTQHTAEIAGLAISPDGRSVATGGFDNMVYVHPLSDESKPGEFIQGRNVHHLAYSPDGTTLASGSCDGLVKVWDLAQGRKRSTLKGQTKPLHALCYSPDGQTIATAGGEGTLILWNVRTCKHRLALDFGIGTVHAVAFAPDGMRAAAGGLGQIVIWDIDDWSV